MDEFNRKWITQNALEEIPNYEKGELTIRGLHYRLVARGMTNTITHYKRVVAAMIKARWEDVISFDTFSDNDRAMIGETRSKETNLDESIEEGKIQIKSWMNYYFKNKWENQPYYPEVFIEKKALQGIFGKPCARMHVTLGACKGYPSLTFIHDAYKRFKNAVNKGKRPIILYFGDYDPSGEDIPRSIGENLSEMGVDVEVRRISLLEKQVVDWNLPPAPIKEGDSRSKSWNGLGQVELDAVEPKELQKMCATAIEGIFNEKLYDELKNVEAEEQTEYRIELKRFVNEDLEDD